jgi:hypothetical protein
MTLEDTRRDDRCIRQAAAIAACVASGGIRAFYVLPLVFEVLVHYRTFAFPLGLLYDC